MRLLTRILCRLGIHDRDTRWVPIATNDGGADKPESFCRECGKKGV